MDFQSYESNARFRNQPERRQKRRFPIEREARYRLLFGHRLAETGVARTINISSNGVWIQTSAPLPEGVPIELSISWPVLLNEYTPMKLVIYGCVIRSRQSGAAISIERYELRTQGKGSFQTTPVKSEELRLPN